MTDKLVFKYTGGPERGTILPIPMTREKWFSIAVMNNLARQRALTYQWPSWKVEEVYADLYPA